MVSPALVAVLLLAQPEEKPSPVPLAWVDRPLTTPEDAFELIFELAYSQLGSRWPVVIGEAGARYGHTADFEVGIRLLRLSMSPAPDTGLNNPMAFLRYRVLSGVLELAGYLETEIPVGGVYEANARIEMLLRLGRLVRIDLGPTVGVFAENPWRFRGLAPLEIAFQLGDHVKLSAVGIIELYDLEQTKNVLGRAGARLVYTFGGEKHATADLGLLVTTPNLALSGERPDDPALNNYFLALVDLRWFIANESRDDWQGFD
jgi:hypothetical protein